MNLDQLRKVHQKRPFRPFRLRVADGNECHVRHPELMMVTRTGRVVAVSTPDDAVELIDRALITSIHFEAGNGKGRK